MKRLSVVFVLLAGLVPWQQVVWGQGDAEPQHEFTVHLEHRGMLLTRLAELCDDYDQIETLTITGHLSLDDWRSCMWRLKNLKKVDACGADVNFTSLEDKQVRTRPTIRSIAFPEGIIDLYFKKEQYSEDGTWIADKYELEEIFIPHSAQRIKGFDDLGKLSEIHFASPSSLRTIHDRAFSGHGCDSLIVPEGVEYIGSGAFFSWKQSFRYLELPSTLLELDGLADYNFRWPQPFHIVCHAPVAPVAVDSLVYYRTDPPSTKADWICDVPKDNFRSYEDAQGWKKLTINPVLDEPLPDSLTVYTDIDWHAPAAYNPHITMLSGSISDYYDDKICNGGQIVVPEDRSLSCKSLNMNFMPAVQDCNQEFPYSQTNTLLVRGTAHADEIQVVYYTPKNTWNYLTVPFAVKAGDVRIAGVTDGVEIFAFSGAERANDETRFTSSWRHVEDDEMLEPGKGYAFRPSLEYWNRNDRDFLDPSFSIKTTDCTFENKNVTLPLYDYPSSFAHNSNWNFVGNPYPCFVSIKSLNTTAPVVIPGWGCESGNYHYPTFYTYSPSDDDILIAPGQGFFIQKEDKASELVFDASGRNITNKKITRRDHDGPGEAPSAVGKAPLNDTPEALQRRVWNIELRKDSATDRARYVFNPEATAGYEAGRDAVKFASEGLSLSLINGDVRYSINETPNVEALWLDVQTAGEGEYTIILGEGTQGSMILEDLQRGIEVAVTASQGYTFKVHESSTLKASEASSETLSGNESSVKQESRFRIRPNVVKAGTNGHVSLILGSFGQLKEEIRTYLGGEDLSKVTSLTITGCMDYNDYSVLRSRFTNLQELDIHGVCSKYSKNSETESLPNQALEGMGRLTTLLLPDSITEMGDHSMEYCRSLKAIAFPEKVTKIDGSAFYYCDSLTSITLPQHLTYLGNSAFAQCHGLKNVVFNNGLQYIYENTFYDCISLEEIELPEGILAVRSGAFGNCNSLKYASLPSTLMWFDYDVFDFESKRELKSLETVDCHAVVSPFVTLHEWKNSIPRMSETTLRVPHISVSNYRSGVLWSKVGKIEGVDLGAETPRAIGIAYEATMNLSTDEIGGYRPDITLRNINTKEDYNDIHSDYECLAASLIHEAFSGKMIVPQDCSLAANSLTFDIQPGSYSDYNWNSSMLVYGSLNTTYSTARLIHKDGWAFFTVPFTVRVGDIVSEDPEYEWVIRSYDGDRRAAGRLDETWVQLTADSLLQPGHGYIFQCQKRKQDEINGYFRMPAYVYGSGRLASTDTRYLTTEDIDVPLNAYPSEYSVNAGWNLAGNPYPCYYDIAYSSLHAPFIVYVNDYVYGSYEAYNPVDDDFILTPGQAFFVQGQPEAGMDKITFFKEGRQNCRCKRTAPLLAPPSPLSAEAARESSSGRRTKWEILLLETAQKSITDKTRVVYNPDAQMGYESSSDAPKFMSMDPVRPQLWTVNDGTRYSINERPENDGWVRLGILAPEGGKLTLKLSENAEYKVIVEDVKTGVRTVITDREGLTVTLPAGTTEDRYKVRLYNEATGIDEAEASQASKSGDTYNLSGQKATENYNGIIIRNGQKIKK